MSVRFTDKSLQLTDLLRPSVQKTWAVLRGQPYNPFPKAGPYTWDVRCSESSYGSGGSLVYLFFMFNLCLKICSRGVRT